MPVDDTSLKSAIFHYQGEPCVEKQQQIVIRTEARERYFEEFITQAQQ